MKKIFYRVRKGDTLLNISARFCLSPFNIIVKNNLNKEVEEGDIVYLEKGEKYYKVQLGDTYFSLAKELGVSEEYLKSKNYFAPYLFFGLIISI